MKRKSRWPHSLEQSKWKLHCSWSIYVHIIQPHYDHTSSWVPIIVLWPRPRYCASKGRSNVWADNRMRVWFLVSVGIWYLCVCSRIIQRAMCLQIYSAAISNFTNSSKKIYLNYTKMPVKNTRMQNHTSIDSLILIPKKYKNYTIKDHLPSMYANLINPII